MNLEFKLLDENYLEETIKLCDECFNETTSLEYARRVYEENKNDDKQIYLIGLLNGEVVAHTKITVIPTIYEDMNTFAILNHVCVKEKYRRNHIGTKMLDECFKIAKEHNCKCVELWSKNFRVAAHAMYNNYGFEVMDAKFFTKNVD